MEAEGPAPQCPASPARQPEGAALLHYPSACRAAGVGQAGLECPVPQQPVVSPSCPTSCCPLLSSPCPCLGVAGRAACPRDLPVGVGAAEGQQPPGSPGSPPAAGQRGMGQVSVAAGLSHLAGLGNAWQRLGLLWGWGAAPWAGGQMRCFWDRGMDRGSR